MTSEYAFFVARAEQLQTRMRWIPDPRERQAVIIRGLQAIALEDNRQILGLLSDLEEEALAEPAVRRAIALAKARVLEHRHRLLNAEPAPTLALQEIV